MKMKKDKGILIKNLAKTHENKWVALSADRKKILASSISLKSLKEKIGDNKVIYTRILPANISFAF
ncbi:MAG: hypothetical protein AAB794_04190 [Patescibacteria group bacterium]